MSRPAAKADVMTGAVQVERSDERDVEGNGSHRCRGLRARPAVHSYTALSFLLEGAITVEQGVAQGGPGRPGRHVERWRLAAGDVMLVPAGMPHRVVEKRGLVRWSVGFCPACFAAALGPDYSYLVAPFERVRAGGAAVVSIASERRTRLEGWLAELELASARRDPAGQSVQKSLLTLVLDEIGRADAAAPEEPSASIAPAAPPLAEPSDLVAASLRFIELNCLSPLSLGEVAAAVGKSPAHLTTVIRRATGKSAVQWIIAGRMAEARRRLLAGDEAVEDISARVGYADPTHFIRMFRREHGMTPAAWRRGLP